MRHILNVEYSLEIMKFYSFIQGFCFACAIITLTHAMPNLATFFMVWSINEKKYPNFSHENWDIFSHLCSKHRILGHVRTASGRRF